MRLLFTKSNKIGSKLICWGLNEPVSHVAMEDSGIVLHSRGSGVDFDSYTNFIKINTVVEEIELKDFTFKDLAALGDRYEGSHYDFKGLCYFIYIGAQRKLFDVDFPIKSRYNIPGAYLCTELVSLYLLGYEDNLITPYGLYLKLSETL